MLDVFGGLIDDLTPVIQFPSNGGSNQLWTLEPLADGYVRTSLVTAARHWMSQANRSMTARRSFSQYTPHDGANPQWLLRAIAPRDAN